MLLDAGFVKCFPPGKPLPDPERLARVEDYRAQVASLSLNFFYFLLPLTPYTPSRTYTRQFLRMTISRRDSPTEDY